MEVESGTWIISSEEREHKELSSFWATVYKRWRCVIESQICFHIEFLRLLGLYVLVKRRILLYLNLHLKVEVRILKCLFLSFLLLLVLLFLPRCFRVSFLLPLLLLCFHCCFGFVFSFSRVIIAIVAFQDTKVYTIITEHFIWFCWLGRLLIEVKDLAVSAREKVLLIALITIEIKGYNWWRNKAVITVKGASRLLIIPVRNDAKGLSRFFCLSSSPLIDWAFLFVDNFFFVWLLRIIKFASSIVCTIVFHYFWLN